MHLLGDNFVRKRWKKNSLLNFFNWIVKNAMDGLKRRVGKLLGKRRLKAVVNFRWEPQRALENFLAHTPSWNPSLGKVSLRAAIPATRPLFLEFPFGPSRQSQGPPGHDYTYSVSTISERHSPTNKVCCCLALHFMLRRNSAARAGWGWDSS